MRKNIEIKARYEDLLKARRLARELGARKRQTLVQVDTYLRVAHGRLKLREITGDQHRAELIWYQRSDQRQARQSSYTIFRVDRPRKLKATLDKAIGIWKIVRKRRELWMHRNIRIHLDRVEGLGNFVELEAVVGGRYGIHVSQANLAIVQRALELTADMLVPGSYSDLIET